MSLNIHPHAATGPRRHNAPGGRAEQAPQPFGSVIPLDRARMARAVRDRPLIDLFTALSAGDAARRELARQRRRDRLTGVACCALSAVTMLYFIAQLLRWALS